MSRIGVSGRVRDHAEASLLPEHALLKALVDRAATDLVLPCANTNASPTEEDKRDAVRFFGDGRMEMVADLCGIDSGWWRRALRSSVRGLPEGVV